MESHHKIEHPKLNQFLATAICGNDILSSTLYVSGIAILFAGIYAPIVLACIGLILYFYKAVYTEVVEALPINGGAYNCLLNSTSKTIAAIAGITTFLSYVATAVISAEVGVQYVHTLIPIPVIASTIVLLFIFAVLVIGGISDSAKVALGIFAFHVLVLTSVLVFGAVHYFTGHSYLMENIAHTGEIMAKHGSLLKTIFFAVSASLLGVSGFESSANFVEEQDKGVFRKTLRNMLIGVVIFNPLIALVCLNSMPMSAIIAAKDFLLSDVAHAIGGSFLQIVVVADAFLVLAGAVLTAYVGVSGLLSRMAGDNCLPNLLAKQNRKGSFPRIVLSFFVLCSSILLITHGELLSLAGVYTIAFLGVMSLFAFGNLTLRVTRNHLKRTYRAPLLFVFLAAASTLLGLLGNIEIDPENLRFFLIYFIPAAVLVLCMVYQDLVVKFLVNATKFNKTINTFLIDHFHDLQEGQFVAFIRNPDMIFGFLKYIENNETGCDITIVNCRDKEFGDKNYKIIQEIIPCLQQAGVFPDLKVKLIYKDKPFSPEVVSEISKELNIRRSRMFIGSIHHYNAFNYDELGGVRVVFEHGKEDFDASLLMDREKASAAL